MLLSLVGMLPTDVVKRMSASTSVSMLPLAGIDSVASDPSTLPQTQTQTQTEAHTEELTDEQYNTLCKPLLHWWSSGCLQVDVMDGERFNQEIFLGQVILLLTGFLVLLKSPDELEIVGSFPLEKRAGHPSDRVSGTIRLAAYLHVPSRSMLSELLRQALHSSAHTSSSGISSGSGSSITSNRNIIDNSSGQLKLAT